MSHRFWRKQKGAGLYRAGPLKDRSAPRRVRGFNTRGYWTEFAKPPRVISARTVSPTFFCLMTLVPWPT